MEYLTNKILIKLPALTAVLTLHCIELNAVKGAVLLEWSKATCFQLGWGYRILVVKYSIEGQNWNWENCKVEVEYFWKTST